MSSANFFDSSYGDDAREHHIITDKHIEIIRKLKFKVIKDGYYDCQPFWSYEDNKDILNGEDIEDIGLSMQFITLLGNPSIDVEKHFMELLRRSYIDSESQNNKYEEEGGAFLACKRPFGNSSVLSDVREEMARTNFYKNNNISDPTEEDREDYEIEEKELEKFVKFLTEDFFKNFTLDNKFREFIKKKDKNRLSLSYKEGNEYWEKFKSDIKDMRFHWYLSDIRLSESHIRNEKLNKLLS